MRPVVLVTVTAKLLRLFLLAASCWCLSSLPLSGQTFVSFDAEWNYYKGTEEASSPTTTWRLPAWDDSAWSIGPSPIRYGDGTGGTVLADMRNRYSTVFLRKTFTVDSPEAIETLEAAVDFDDGFILWINGTEVFQINGPDQPTYDSFSSGSHESGTPERYTFPLPAKVLVAGTNLLAVQLFNSSLNSSDCLFNLELRAGLTPLPEPWLSVESGFYSAAFEVSLVPPLAEARVRYTTNGSAPTLMNGRDYHDPIGITGTTVIRATAWAEGYAPSKTTMRSYFFANDIIRQPKDLPGWPRPTVSIGQGTAIHDYEMDPRIVEDPAYAPSLVSGLLSLPTLSLAVDQADMWDLDGNGGFYRGDIEKPVGVEFVHPANPEINTRALAGIQGHSHDRMKRSLRLKFRAEYGDAKLNTRLLKEAPLNGESAVARYDRLVLRGGNNRCWARSWNPDKTAYTLDQWFRDSQVAMSGYGSRGTFVHLYINGLYWGLYNPVERPDTWFTSTHFGGEREDWFAISHGGPQGGDPVRWNYLMNTLVNRDLSNPDNYQEFTDYLDVSGFIDYLLLCWYINVVDWPQNNWWAGVSNQPPGPVRFFAWDGEWAFGLGQSPGSAWVHPDFRATKSGGPGLAQLWHAARANPDFMMLVADRAYAHLSQQGGLSDGQARDRWSTLNAFVRNAVVAESARWGDVTDENNPRTRDRDWQNEVDRIDQAFGGNGAELIADLRAEGFYPLLDPPRFSQASGFIPVDTPLLMTNPNPRGTAYFTTDGSDPRQAGSDQPGPTAAPFLSALPIDQSQIVKARVREAGEWSALQEAVFITEIPDLRITELLYHPLDPSPTEQLAGFSEDESFEFIELLNTGDQALELEGFRFTAGVEFTFPPWTLLAGEHVVVAADAAAFQQRYGTNRPVAGRYVGHLDNGGEQLVLQGGVGEIIHDFTYSDGWHPATDGAGYSLVISDPRQPRENWLSAAHWIPGMVVHGTPGQGEPSLIRLTAARPSNNSIQIELSGAPSYPFILQSSVDLSQWVPVWTNSFGVQGQAVWEANPSSIETHPTFYRAVQE